MQHIFWVTIATAVFCTTNGIPVENHQESPENLKDYWNWDAFSPVDTCLFKNQTGGLRMYSDEINGTIQFPAFVSIYPGFNSTVEYSLDFSSNRTATTIELGLAADYPPGLVTEINVYVDTTSSPPVSTLYLNGTGYLYTFVTFTADFTIAVQPQGLHDVYFVFAEQSLGYYCNFNWFQFS